MTAKIKWTYEMDALLGTITDKAIARRFGIGRLAVNWRRRKLGIRALGHRVNTEWTDEMDALLGTLIDREVADKLGISGATVCRRRGELGIPVFKSPLKEGRYQVLRTLRNDLTYKQWRFACDWFEDCCAYCGAKVFLTEDHLVPLSKEGPRTALNIIPVCWSCNSSKCDRTAHLWIYKKFGMDKGKEIVDRIVAYLTEVQGPKSLDPDRDSD